MARVTSARPGGWLFNHYSKNRIIKTFLTLIKYKKNKASCYTFCQSTTIRKNARISDCDCNMKTWHGLTQPRSQFSSCVDAGRAIVASIILPSHSILSCLFCSSLLFRYAYASHGSCRCTGFHAVLNTEREYFCSE